MSQAPSMPVFTDALIGDTLHLTAEEFGCYCLLLFATWRNNGEALLDDAAELAQICRVTPQRWRGHMRAKLVRFFDVSDGHWHQKRLEKEWCAVQKKVQANRINGPKGGRPRKNPNETERKPTGLPKTNPIETQPEPTQTHSQKLASNSDSDSLPSEWGERAAAERAKAGLPEVDLQAEWASLVSKIGDIPTEDRWIGWVLKARVGTANGAGGKANGSGILPEAPWPQRCRSWAKGHRWEPDWGPPPGQPGCFAPADVVAGVLRQIADNQSHRTSAA